MPGAEWPCTNTRSPPWFCPGGIRSAVVLLAVTGVVLAAFFALYLTVMLKLLSLRPVPFVVAFVSYFIALYAMQALFLRRLTTIK